MHATLVPLEPNRRVLIVDDTQAIHSDSRNILQLGDDNDTDLAALEADFFGSPEEKTSIQFELGSAYQGEDAYKMVRTARQEGRPFALVFMDIRMPPGWDGMHTTSLLLEEDPYLFVVICSAYSDYKWEDFAKAFGETDRVLALKKPFDVLVVRQLAHSLQKLWEHTVQDKLKLNELLTLAQAQMAELSETKQKLAAKAATLEKAEEEVDLEFIEDEVPKALGRASNALREVERIVMSMREC